MGVEAVQGVPRGCGTRTSGGVYLECGTGYGGRPLEFFLADPPIPLTCDTKLGVQLIERDGVVHVLDWIGEQHYPNCADFLEKAGDWVFHGAFPRPSTCHASAPSRAS